MQPLVVSTSDASTAEKESDWIMCDAWTPGLLSVQVNVYNQVGDPDVEYSVYTTMDDPNDPVAPVDIANMTWLPFSDANLVTSILSAQAYSAFTPRYIKLVQLTGPGSATMTVCQAGSVTL